MSSSHVNRRAAGDGAFAAEHDDDRTRLQPPPADSTVSGQQSAGGERSVTLFDPEDVVESPASEESGVGSGFFRPSAATWPEVSTAAATAAAAVVPRRVVGSASATLGEDRLRMSVNPRYSVTESLRSANSSRTSLVALGESARPAQRGRRSRAATLEVQDIALPDEAQEEEEPIMATQEQDGGPVMEAALPENDGMQSLRQKLLEIKLLALSTEEKAKRMHDLMTRDYLAHRASLAPSTPPMQASPSQRPLEKLEPSILAPPVDPTNPYSLCPSDVEPCFSPVHYSRADTHGDERESMDEDDAPVLGCQHYKRNVKVQCFDCHRWFPCRHCHDAAKDLPFPHSLNRKKTQNMLCMLCKTPQPASETCMSCGEYAAWYYCSKCKLWDNDNNKRIYHCDDCGLCRLGEGLGKDFVHCKRCNVCISIQTSSAHPCIERATDSNCPLCLSYLFESPTPVVSLPCGHYMHGTCYKDLMGVTYKCPVCSKSAVNMELQWKKLDDEIAFQPMPEDDSELETLLPHLEGAATEDANPHAPPRRPRKAWISCNDCNARCWTAFHWLGLKCHACGGYNTNQIPPSTGRETEAERLIRQQQLQPRQHDFTGNGVLLDAGIGIASSDDGHRVDSGYGMPSSPTSLSPSAAANIARSPSYNPDRRASAGPSSPRRYFVQEEEPRRASFTAPRFPTPSMPNLPRMPDLPRIPDLPSLPQMPRFPDMPNLPTMPNMPNLEIPRFSPYEMVQALSRSLSPMRYYMEGLDVRDAGVGSSATQRAGRLPARRSFSQGPESPPVPGASSGSKKAKFDGESAGFWASAVLSSGEEDDDEDEEAEGEDESESEFESESEDDEAEEVAVESIEDDDDDVDELELFGHR